VGDLDKHICYALPL